MEFPHLPYYYADGQAMGIFTHELQVSICHVHINLYQYEEKVVIIATTSFKKPYTLSSQRESPHTSVHNLTPLDE